LILIACGKYLRDFFPIDICRIVSVYFHVNKAVKTILTRTNPSYFHMTTDDIVLSISDSLCRLLLHRLNTIYPLRFTFFLLPKPFRFFPLCVLATFEANIGRDILATKTLR